MKKYILPVAVAMVLFIAVFVMASCYLSRPAEEESVEGTYELFVFTRTPRSDLVEEGAENTTVNLIETKGITAYLVLKGDGRGYYVYKDNQTPLFAREVRVTFDYEDEDKTIVEEIHYSWDSSIGGDGWPGKGKESLGVNFKDSKKILAFNLPAGDSWLINREYSQTVRYQKVSDKTDLSYVFSKVGEVSYASYETANLDGIHVFSEGYGYDNLPYAYYIVDLNPVTMKANVVYYDKAEDQQKTLTNVDVTAKVPTKEEIQQANEEMRSIPDIVVKIGNEEFKMYYNEGSPANTFRKVMEATETTEYGELYFVNYGRTQTVTEIVQAITEQHRQSETIE